jgi:hypothetical protein
LNIYLSIVYYIKLRNDSGVIGSVGPKGPSGIKGSPGKCSFESKCGIDNPRQKILNIANTMYNIPQVCLDKPSLKNCKDQDTLENAMPINKQIDMLKE